VSSIGIRPLHTAAPAADRRLPRGPGLALAALVSLALWAGLIHLALTVFGA
jgi:hypothetical protein